MNKKKIVWIAAGSVVLICLAAAVVVLCVRDHRARNVISSLQTQIRESSVQEAADDSGSSAYSGTIGDNLTWKINPETFTLTVGGQGAMVDKFNDDIRPSYFISYGDKIRHIVIGNGVTSVAPYAFAELSNLETVQFGDSVRSIGEYAFFSSGNNTAYGLRSVVLNSALETIDSYAFDGCYNNEELTLSEKYHATDYAPLHSIVNTPYVTKITVPEENPWYSSKDGCVFSKDGAELLYCCVGDPDSENPEEWPDFEIPATVKTMETCCFSGNRIRTLTIPGNVSKMEDMTLWNVHVQKLVVKEGVKLIGNMSADTIEELALPDSVIKVDEGTYADAKVITFSENSAALKKGKDGFIYTKDMKTLVRIPEEFVEDGYAEDSPEYTLIVPDGVQHIADSATMFLSYAWFSSVELPDSLESIGDDNFKDIRFASAKQTLKLPKGLKTIGDYCFEDCTLYAITLPASIRSIGVWFLDNTSNGRYDEEMNEWTDQNTKLLVESENSWLALDYEDLPESVDVVFA